MGLSEKGLCEQRLKGRRKGAMQRSEEDILGENQQVSTKALGQEHARNVRRTVRRRGWQEQSEGVETRKKKGQRGDGGQSMCVLESIFNMLAFTVNDMGRTA